MSADPAGFVFINPMDEDGEPVPDGWPEGFGPGPSVGMCPNYSVIEATNWYGYVSNNPVKYVDPTGKFTFSVGLSAQGGAAIGGQAGGGYVLSFNKEDGLKVGDYNSVGFGLFFLLGGSLNLDFSFSGNDNISDLSGALLEVGESGTLGPIPLGVGAAMNVPLPEVGESGAKPVYTISFSLSSPGIEGTLVCE